MNVRTLQLLMFLFAIVTSASAQDADLDRLDSKLRQDVESKMPGWTYRRGQPIGGSKAVLIQSWTITNRGVTIKIVQEKSAEAARETIQRLAHDPSTHAQPLQATGDEAYMWGFDNKQLVFRKGRSVIYVEAGADVNSDPDAPALTPNERKAREEGEVKRIRSEFTKHVLSVLDRP